jgi:hypothetical protein
VTSYRYRPSRRLAITVAVLGAAIMTFGIARMVDGGAAREGGGVTFLVLWCVAGVAVIGVNLRAAFARNGSPATVTRVPDDESGPSA